MCGFVGWAGSKYSKPGAASVLGRMSSEIVHRGPDDSGFYIADGFGFGFQRLSIVDVDAGHQPMSSDCGRYTIVFNGEIYNHDDLREELKLEGDTFSTRSDTEVLLKMYIRYGIEGVSKLNGMFSFAVYDENAKSIILCRDRMGVKPLYYFYDGNSFLFSSEIKAILASGLVDKNLNQGAVWDYLTFRYVPGPQSIWDCVQKLKPASFLQFNLEEKSISIDSYWRSIPTTAFSKEKDFQSEFSSIFEDAVQLRLEADVPVGITLSGGLDSASVVAAASQFKEKLSTFSVAFDGAPDTNELPYARMVSRAFETEHSEIVIAEREFMDFLSDFVWHTDEPLADLASIPLYYVSKLASDTVKVVLSGEGADEILGGYDFDRLIKQWDEISVAKKIVPSVLRGKLGSFMSKFSTSFSSLYNLSNQELDLRKVSEPILMTNYLSSSEKTELLKFPNNYHDSLDVVRKYIDEAGAAHPLNQALYSYSKDWLVEDLLMKADKMSMAASVELRTPFLDYRLVEFANKIPVSEKVGELSSRGIVTKKVLREYASKRMPAEIVDRPKQGFPVPVYDWLSNDIHGWVRDTLLLSDTPLHNYFKRGALEKLVSLGCSSCATVKQKHVLWNFLVLNEWMKKWL